MERDSFVFYRSYRDALRTLPKRDQLNALNAVMDYALDGEDPEVSGSASGMFMLIKPQIDANNRKYENGRKGAQYGVKGGRPKNPKETPSEPLANPKETPNVNVNVNVNDNVNDNEEWSGEPDNLSPPERIIRYLNLKAQRAYQFTETNIGLASELLAKYDEQLVQDVIDNKVAMWKDDRVMAAYLRPKTLFNMENFNNYLDEPIVEGSGL